ncbi:MAG: pyridoxamine 5'-phosphate oxidase family protein [Actinomycetota bacterium]|nr:pyridoxamine 5'-phosphate oxidase family protein [Actinomycetota bacterium]
MDSDGLEILSRAECLRLLASRSVGRVAVSRHALPAILPVSYRLAGEEVVFGAGATHATETRNVVLAFEVDDVDPVTRRGWSVVAVGLAHQVVVVDPEEKDAMVVDPDPWVGALETPLIQLSTDRLTGRRLTEG